ncbi:FHA domain-containing protein [Halopseudomonas pachastrellae]|nr:FHA domain-containing protein [Halopseudomonas pachastrellae]
MELMLEVIYPPPSTRSPRLLGCSVRPAASLDAPPTATGCCPIASASSARRHAQVSYSDEAFYLTDTSSNGIHIKSDGRRLTKASLNA